MSTHLSDTMVTPVDQQIGGDADLAGIAQTVTRDDIQAIVLLDRPLEQRREELKVLRDGLAARANGDLGDDMEPLVHDIDAQLEMLGGEAEGLAAPELLGADEIRSEHAPEKI